MQLTKDVLTFTDVPTKHSSEAEWHQVIVRKRQNLKTLLEPWSCVDRAKLHDLSENTVFVREVPTTLGVLSEDEELITGSSPRRLLKQLALGHWTAEAVLRAFVKRAVIAHELTNVFSEVLFDYGLEQARKLDAHLQSTGKTIGPLHGLPLSTKDVFDVEGVDSALGWASLSEQPKPRTARLIRKLQSAGAVIYCKTTVPQSLMSGECVSYVCGRTMSPFNTRLSAGGSSGGEAALISMRGSPLGIGTDIAGSVRTPANFCGIYSLCPSSGRLPLPSTSGMEAIKGVHGPMSRSVEGLEVYTRALLSTEPWTWDQATAPLPWREDEFEKGIAKERPLVFGLMRHDGVVRPHPPIEHGLEDLKRSLEAAGHTVVDFSPSAMEIAKMSDITWSIFGSTGYNDVCALQAILDEPLIGEIPTPDPSTAVSAAEYFDLNCEKTKLRQRFIDAWFATSCEATGNRPIDALIMPSGGHVAPPHGTMTYFIYEAISNVLDLPCATFPVDCVRVDQQYEAASFTPMSDQDAENWAKYDPESFANGPISMQVMGLAYGEEKLIGTLRTMDKALGRPADFQV